MGLFEYPLRNEGEKEYFVERSYADLGPFLFVEQGTGQLGSSSTSSSSTVENKRFQAIEKVSIKNQQADVEQ